MKIITIGSIKGGCGKSTTSVSISSILANEHKKSVLLIDADHQGNSSNYMRLDETRANYINIKNIFEDTLVNIEDAVNDTQIENLKIIGSTPLLTATEMKLVTLPGREYVLKKFFNKNIEFFSRFDYVIFDTSPSFSITNQNIFTISDSIILVSDVGIGGYKGIELFNLIWNGIRKNLNIEENIKALLLTRVKKTTKLSREYTKFLETKELTKNLLLKSNIKDSIKLAEAELKQTPINIYAKNSKSSMEYRTVVKELFEKGVL